MTSAFPLRIYYDGQCPLCAREMHALKSGDVSGRLDLVDCSPLDFSDPWLQQAQVSPSQAMAFIHARDGEGNWLTGIAVFEAAYSAVGLESVARLWAHPWLRPGWIWLYPHVARHRMLLSRLGLGRAFGGIVSFAARRASRRAASCGDRACASPPPEHGRG